MIIISNKTGQLANRLFAFSHVISNSIEHDIPVLNLNFQEYSPYFKATSTHDFGPYKITTRKGSSGLWNKFLNICITAFVLVMLPIRSRGKSYALMGLRDDEEIEVDLSDPELLKLSQKKYLFIRGWGFWDSKNLTKHREEIQKMFSLIPHHRNAVDTLVNACRQEADILVGLHIRAGDYRNWRGGIYFYETDIYVQKARELEALLSSPTQKVAFVICSNETQDLAKFEGLRVFHSTDHFIEDLYTLASCDYIMGPPSTYSMWASFYGEKPFLHLERADQEISLDDFQIKND